MSTTAPHAQKTTLGIVMGILNVSNSELGRRLGINTENVRQRRAGETSMKLGDVHDYAKALGVPSHLLAMDVADVFRWFADHPDTALTSPFTAGEANSGIALFDVAPYDQRVTVLPPARRTTPDRRVRVA